MCFKGVGCFTCCNDVLVEQTGIHSTDSRLVLLCLMIHTPTSASSGRLYRCYISYVWLLLNQPGYSWLDLIPTPIGLPNKNLWGLLVQDFLQTQRERGEGGGEGEGRGSCLWTVINCTFYIVCNVVCHCLWNEHDDDDDDAEVIIVHLKISFWNYSVDC